MPGLGSAQLFYDRTGGAPITPSYVVIGLDGSLTNERVLTGTTNQITITDNGAGNSVVISLPQDIHAGASPQFDGLTLSGGMDFGTGGLLADNELTLPATGAVINLVNTSVQTVSGEITATNSSAVTVNLTAPFTSTVRGLVPASGGGTTNFLRADGSFANPLTGALLAANNLSDVASATTARTNLGLGSGDSPTFTGLTLTGLTAGRVPYVGASDELADDSEFLWDSTNNVLKLSSAWGGTRDALGLQIQRTVTTPLDATPGAVRPILAVRGTFAGSGKVSQGRIGGYFYTEDDASVRNVTITGAANNGSGGIRITAAGHGFATGDSVNVYGVGGTVEANNAWTITVIDANTFDLNSSTYTNAYTSGGTVTNRGLHYALSLDVKPIIDRDTFLFQNNGVNGDDVAALTISNSGQTATATDAIWITDAGTAGRKAWHSILASDSGTNYFISYFGKIYSCGIDLASATLNSSSLPMIRLGSGHNIELDSAGNGTKIGTSTSQKLGFFNATPIVQNTSTTDLRTGLINLGFFASGGASPLDLNGGALTAGSATVAGAFTVDTNTFVVDATNNRVGIGTASPSVDFDLVKDGGGFTTIHTSYGTTQSIYRYRRARNTLAAPRRVQATDVLGNMQFWGAQAADDVTDATFGASAAIIRVTARTSFTSTDRWNDIEFLTTDSGASASATHFVIGSTGITVGTGALARSTTNPNHAINILNSSSEPAGTLTNAVSVYASGGKLKSADAAGTIGHVLSASAVNTVSPTSPNRTLTVDINGTTYYIHAKTTND